MKICPLCGASYDDANVFCTVDGAALRSLADGSDLIHTVIADRYLITEQLGEGGMGRVYLAKHVRLPQKWAIKVLHPALVRDAAALARFNQEAASASRIENRHVARVIDFGETGDGLLYLAMEYVDGESLSNVIEREGALEPLRAAGITSQVAEALTAAHELGIVHRDLKPDNIMVGRSRDGSDDIRVVDFGIAKVIQQDDAEKVTRTGFAIGTPEYMSPEQIRADTVDGRSDVYSLALVTFRMLTGLLPFPADTPQERMFMRVTTPPCTLSEMRSDVEWPAALQAVLDRALARDVGERYQSAASFARDLVRAVQEWRSPREAETPGVVRVPGAPPSSPQSGARPGTATPIAAAAEAVGTTAAREAPAVPGVPDAPRNPGTAANAVAGPAAGAQPAGTPRASSTALKRGALAVAAVALIGVGTLLFARSDSRSIGDAGDPQSESIPRGAAAASAGASAAATDLGTPPRSSPITPDSPARAAAAESTPTTSGGADVGIPASTPSDPRSTSTEPGAQRGADEQAHDAAAGASRPSPGTGRTSGSRDGGTDATTAAAALRARARLDGLQALVEDLTESGARSALGAIPAILPDLATRSDTVEAWYYGLQANLILGDVQEACRIVGAIGTDARTTAFAAPVKIFSDSLRCR